MKILQSTGVPIYQQIADQLKEEIMAGKRKHGDALPSIRSLAKELKISVITTMKAYEELEQQGLVIAVQGKGYFVSIEDSGMLREQHMRKIEDSLLSAIAAARLAGVPEDELVSMLKTLLQAENM